MMWIAAFSVGNLFARDHVISEPDRAEARDAAWECPGCGRLPQEGCQCGP